jgi:aspartate aminotransferase
VTRSSSRRPYWVSYPALVQLADGVSVFVATEPENDFLVSVEQLEAARTPRTRCLVMNTPSNPTGCHYTKAQLDAIAAWAVEKGVFVISDEIYDQLVYAPAKPASLAAWWQRHPENFAVVNGLAKSFAMTGWRVGYTLAHADLIKAMTKIQGQSTSNICSIAQKAALAALTGGWDCLAPMLEAFVRRRDHGAVHDPRLGACGLPGTGRGVLSLPAGGLVLYAAGAGFHGPVRPAAGKGRRGPGAWRGFWR